MFGKRANPGMSVMPAPASAPQNVAPPPAEPARPSAEYSPAPDPQTDQRSESYFQTKSMIFGALIEAIDLAALSKLDQESAREEIRDIVHEIVTIKNLILSISEQEDLLDDICNDVLGFGPLEPLLARDDIADIMVNGPQRTFIEVGGKIQLTNIRFRDGAQLMNICQRIVSQVGRRVDEASPICDARLLDGSRVNVIAPPLAIDGAALTIRKFKKDKLTLDQLTRFGAISPAGAEILKIIGRVRCNVVISGGTGSGKDDAAQLPDQLHRGRRARHHLRRRGRTAASAATRRAPGNAPAQSRRRRTDHDARFGQELSAYASRTHHRGRSARTRGVRSPAGDEHGPRRLDGHVARQFASRGSEPNGIDDHHGRLRAALAHDSRNDLRFGRCDRAGRATCATAPAASPTSPR